MSARRRPARKDAQLAFEALSVEGGLLSPDWLARVAQLAAGQQSEADYRVPKGLNLRDEIGRYWRIAQACWGDFATGKSASGDPQAVAERFVQDLLRESFGFTSLQRTEPAVLADRTYPIGFSALGGRVPVAIVTPQPEGDGAKRGALDDPRPELGDGGRRRSAFGLAQEFLNAEDKALWGVVSDGLTLRVLRDNASLTRPAWIEADLGRIFTEERYADFAALWLILHETRFGKPDQAVTECALEAWRNAGRDEGTRAREHLRRGVEDALVALGQGFVAHPDNQALRGALQDGSLTTTAYFQELLRLVYRLIFLLTVEERGLLHAESTGDEQKKLYADGYSLRRLRERAVKRSAHDRHADLWEGVKVVFRGVATGEPRLGLPALAGIFAKGQCLHLDASKLENRALLLAVFRLSWLREASGLARVNWRDMGPEELGSVYESLLELVPQITKDGRSFAFASGGETKGNARKTSGSYYTPDSLVQVLLDSALEPVVADTIANNPTATVEGLLSLSIVDPACGSGHFLLAAARRLAGHVARLQANGTPSAGEYRRALRQVVGRCVYGVDLNPMAVELCKVSLWMEAVEPGLPLTFLDSHIQHGNALLGTTPELMEKGIPDAAWEPIEGDDKKTASALKKRNKKEREEPTLNLGQPPDSLYARLVSGVRAVDEASDANLPALEAKERQWIDLVASAGFGKVKFLADMWCAAFVWPKPATERGVVRPEVEAAPTHGTWTRVRDGEAQPALETMRVAKGLAKQYTFFHWHLAFPQVFAKGGFDVVLGNPPWESLRLIEKEFFAATAPEIAEAENSAKRKALITELKDSNPYLYGAFAHALRGVEGFNAFVVGSDGYPLCGVGRVNLFALFAEAARSLVSTRGRVGQILPSGIVSDDSTKLFFQHVVERQQLVSFFDFENREAIFCDVHRSFKFGVLTLAGARRPNSKAEFVFFATRVDQLKDPNRRFTLSAEELSLVNPISKTCPIFRSRRDADLTIRVYERWKTLPASDWNVSPRFPLDIGRASSEFRRRRSADVSPLYEGKYFHQFDHRWVTRDGDSDRALTDGEREDPSYAIRPRYLYPTADLIARYESLWSHRWTLCWRDIVRSTDERTVIATVVPSLAVAHTAWLLIPAEDEVSLLPYLLAMLNSLAFDFVARQKVGGIHLNKFIFDQLPFASPSTFACPSSTYRTTLGAWLLPRVLELTYTAWDLEPFARDVGYDGPPFRWDPARRFLLRCELDAAFFHLYGLSRDDTDYVMDTFPIVRKNDEKAHGEYRTKRVILEIYDAMAEAARTGKPYQTRLDPPPADPRVAHPESTRPEWAKGGKE